MTATEKQYLGFRKAYLADILKPCWMQQIIDKKTYMGLMCRMKEATPEQVEKGIILYKGLLNKKHDSQNQSR